MRSHRTDFFNGHACLNVITGDRTVSVAQRRQFLQAIKSGPSPEFELSKHFLLI